MVAAGLAQAGGRHDLAFYFVLAAVPVLAAVALVSYGDVIAGEGGVVQTALWTLALLLLLATAALPWVAGAALTGTLAIAAAQVVLVARRELGPG